MPKHDPFERVKCLGCMGSGKCFCCDGTGRSSDGKSCPACNGTCRCICCNGTGKKFYYEQHGS